MVFGYPLAGSLTSSGNFTSGLVSGLRGLRDAAGQLQITAPVQPGNSGGPLMDASGLVIGVVQAKLDALRSAVATGDIPQNVNFAISLEVLVEFLTTNNVQFRNRSRAAPMDTAQVAEMAQTFTHRVECRRTSQQSKAARGAARGQRTKYCVVLYSHNFKGTNSKPIHYKYQWCKSGGKCTAWKQRSLKPGGKSFASRVQCYNATQRAKMKVRYDWMFASGFQGRTYTLKPQTFPYKKDRLPNSGCIRRAAYHFVSRDGKLRLYSGAPKDVKHLSCRWVNAQ